MRSTALAMLTLFATPAIAAAVTGSLTWPHAPPALLLGGLLVALATIDWLTWRLPDPLNLALLGAGLAVAALHGSGPLGWSALSAAAAFTILWMLRRLYRYLRGRDGLGFGDVKLIGAGASWVGVTGLATVVLVAAGGALVLVALMALAGRRIDGATTVPFGPFLAFGLWIVWLFGSL